MSAMKAGRLGFCPSKEQIVTDGEDLVLDLSVSSVVFKSAFFQLTLHPRDYFPALLTEEPTVLDNLIKLLTNYKLFHVCHELDHYLANGLLKLPSPMGH